MPNIDEMNDSRFLTAAECGEQGKLLVIEYVTKQNVSPRDQPPKEKWCSYHSNGVKPLVLNKTNRQKIAEILGSKETDDWTRGRVVAYKASGIIFQGKMVEGIRIRAPGSGQNGDGANGGEKPAPVRPHPPVPLSQSKSGGAEPEKGEVDIPF
jgi:hypothetical protein